jgi:hypothetical protein
MGNLIIRQSVRWVNLGGVKGLPSDAGLPAGSVTSSSHVDDSSLLADPQRNGIKGDELAA